MKKISFVFLLLVIVLASTSQTASAHVRRGYLRFANGYQVILSNDAPQELVVQFGARYADLEGVSVYCETPWLGSIDKQIIAIYDGGSDPGPFDIVGGFYGQNLIYGAYRSPSTTVLTHGQPYQISFFVYRTDNEININWPIFRSMLGTVTCTLYADNDFDNPIAQDTIYIRTIAPRFRLLRPS